MVNVQELINNKYSEEDANFLSHYWETVRNTLNEHKYIIIWIPYIGMFRIKQSNVLSYVYKHILMFRNFKKKGREYSEREVEIFRKLYYQYKRIVVYNMVRKNKKYRENNNTN